jgi:hypothetical protein
MSLLKGAIDDPSISEFVVFVLITIAVALIYVAFYRPADDTPLETLGSASRFYLAPLPIAVLLVLALALFKGLIYLHTRGP